MNLLTKLLNFSFNHQISIIVALVIFFCAFFASLPIIWLLKKYAHKLALVDIPSERKLHQKNIPVGGGIGIFIGIVCAYFVGWHLATTFSENVSKWGTFAKMPQNFTKDIIVIGIGASIIFIMGLIDDIKDLKPKTKIFIELIVALFLVYNDIRITLFSQNYIFSVGATCFWVLLITNAFNLLDNMDGLSSGVAFISGSIFLVVAVQDSQWTVAFLLIGMLGALLGFLCFNFPPASIFMGDCGSLVIGYMMAVLTIQVTFYQPYYSYFSITLPLLVLAIPLFDTSTVIFIRLRVGHPIFKGDKRHISHRFLKLGMSTRQALITIYLMTFATGISSVLLYQIDFFGSILILLQILIILLIIHILEQVANK